VKLIFFFAESPNGNDSIDSVSMMSGSKTNKILKKIKAKEALIKRDHSEIVFSDNPTKVR
jgi:hypothetical protein